MADLVGFKPRTEEEKLMGRSADFRNKMNKDGGSDAGSDIIDVEDAGYDPFAKI